jgi:hypothetical protein
MGKALRGCAGFDARLAKIVIKSGAKAASPTPAAARKGRTLLRALCEFGDRLERSALGELE